MKNNLVNEETIANIKYNTEKQLKFQIYIYICIYNSISFFIHLRTSFIVVINDDDDNNSSNNNVHGTILRYW
jgi:hypothetical protein